MCDLEHLCCFHLHKSCCHAARNESVYSAHTHLYSLSVSLSLFLTGVFVFPTLIHSSARYGAGCLRFCSGAAGVFQDVSLCHRHLAMSQQLTMTVPCFMLQESRTCTRERSASVRSCWVSRGWHWWWCVTCLPSSTSEYPLAQNQPLTVHDNHPFPSLFPEILRCFKAEDRRERPQTSLLVKGERSAHLKHVEMIKLSSFHLCSLSNKYRMREQRGMERQEVWAKGDVSVMCRCVVPAECSVAFISRAMKSIHSAQCY